MRTAVASIEDFNKDAVVLAADRSLLRCRQSIGGERLTTPVFREARSRRDQ
jgi:hypothetical protein